jgi:hypothetical protein
MKELQFLRNIKDNFRNFSKDLIEAEVVSRFTAISCKYASKLTLYFGKSDLLEKISKNSTLNMPKLIISKPGKFKITDTVLRIGSIRL